MRLIQFVTIVTSSYAFKYLNSDILLHVYFFKFFIIMFSETGSVFFLFFLLLRNFKIIYCKYDVCYAFQKQISCHIKEAFYLI